MPSATATSTLPARASSSRSLRRSHNTASAPDLNSAYSSQSRLLSRKTSFAAIPHSTKLASIPDVNENPSIDSILNDSGPSMMMLPPATPRRASIESLSVGDVVDVPGGMNGTVRFVGTVQGKKGLFVGVELSADFASKGKNSGDVDGVSYFSTNVTGAGMFVPLAKALRRDAAPISMSPTPYQASGLRGPNQSTTSFTPPTPSLQKFSASFGPGSRAPSPAGKKLRPSLSRPESPVRRSVMAPPTPRPALAGPVSKVQVPPRFGSPTNRFTQSVRGTAGDPAKRNMERRPSLGGSRCASSLGPMSEFDEEPSPILPLPPKPTDSLESMSSFSSKMQPTTPMTPTVSEEEVELLRAQLEDRDRQLREQAVHLTEMEGNLTELQQLIESSEAPRSRRDSLDDKDASQLRNLLREKNDKIAMLTAEFDTHRADFRSTIDTLELASTETEKIYEKRIEELMADVRELESRNMDVDSVANQLKQLEELVQELEEGLEDARRGEAEARGEAEHLQGEIERTRAELQREREKLKGGGGGGGDYSVAKELEQKEDEIRGLKALIHSLSRDSVPDADGRTPTNAFFSGGDSIESRIARDNLERQVAELKQALEAKGAREEDLQQEIEFLRTGSMPANRNSTATQRSSVRDSREGLPIRAHEQRGADVAAHKRSSTLDTRRESDTFSTATGDSALWCEICEASGHDILTCTNMFGPDGNKGVSEAMADKDDGLKPLTPTGDDPHPAPLSPARSKTSAVSIPAAVKIAPNPMESGPVAGKESGVLDLDKWCAVCERDGHDSVDCPFEDAF